MSHTSAALSAFRRQALAYRYDFNINSNVQIISEIYRKLASHIDSSDDAWRTTTRAIAHYLAHLKLRPTWSKWLFEIPAIPALPVLLIYLWSKGLFNSQAPKQTTYGIKLVFSERFKTNPEIFSLPAELTRRDVATRMLGNGTLYGRDVIHILKLLSNSIRMKIPFPIQLVLKCAIDLSKVRGALDNSAPEWVAVYWEFNCAITFIAAVLKKDGIATYNIMHGDKGFFAKHAFFEVTRCYCWHQYYIDLFQKEYVRSDFRVFENPAFHLNPSELALANEWPQAGVGLVTPALATLSAKSRKAKSIMIKLAKTCNTIAEKYDVSVRPHPLYWEDFRHLRPLLSRQVKITAIDCEKPRTFILRNAILVGTNSTMLLEAAHIGKKVIILDTPAIEEIKLMHYIYSQPNVFICKINDLEKTVAAALAQPISLRFLQTKKNDKDLNSSRVERPSVHIS